MLILEEIVMRDDLSKVDYLEEDGAGCSPCQDCPFGKDYEVKEDCEECEDCPCFDAGFNMGFKQGHKVAREELMDDIYINGYKISQIDDIRQKVLALGNLISSDDYEKIDEILTDLTDLMRGVAFEAVEEYLGYR